MIKTGVENSPYRKEIDEMMEEGEPNTVISKWLEEHDAYISRKTLGIYRRRSFNVMEEAAKRYSEDESKKRLDKVVNKVLSNIRFYDKIIEEAHQRDLAEISDKDIMGYGLRAAKQREELLAARVDKVEEDQLVILRDIREALRREGQEYIRTIIEKRGDERTKRRLSQKADSG